MIIHAIFFAGPRIARGAGNDPDHIRPRFQLPKQRGLATSRRCRNDHQQRRRRPGSHRSNVSSQRSNVRGQRSDLGLRPSALCLPPSALRLSPSALRFVAGHLHSTFCACSRNFSNSALSVTTSREMRLSLALEPTVLISRFISWARKSSIRPTGSLDFRQSSNCWK